ncbi:MAG TPA: PAS domain-containing protein [Polyangiaceae bacterium]|nr:PAS domain-containing protein [Polyangiaceae bacterium]
MAAYESVRTEEGSEDSLLQLQSIFEHLADGMFVVRVVEGPDFEFEAINAKTAEWLSTTSAAVRGRRLRDFLPAAEAERVAVYYRRCVETGETQRYEETPFAVQPDMTFQTTLIPAKEARGKVTRIVGIARDISDQRRAARALSESQDVLAKAFRYAPNAMLIVRSADGTYVDVNAAFEQLFECDRSRVIGSREAEQAVWPNVEERRQLIENVRAHGSIREHSARLRTFKGNFRDVLISSDMVMLGGESHLIVNVRDVTKTLDTERTKAELEAQLRQAQKLEALGTLAGGIAHDFNNILGAMVAFIDLIRLDVNDRMAVLGHVSELKTASQRARDLVQQILTFSRAQKPSRSVTKLDLAVREAVKLLRSSLPSSVVIQSSFDEQAPCVLADASQVHQVVMNLGTNAAHAMRDNGGELTLRVEPLVVDDELARRRPDLRPGRYARVVVKDTGQGMDDATLKRIFEPFFTTKKQGEGTGLGLAVVHGIVRDHDGAIAVESRIGEGTTVEVFFPEHIGEPAATRAAPAMLPKGHGERLLVVDDEEALCVSLTHLLTRLGYQVVAKSRPEDALALYRERPSEFALVLTDLTMPGMTGLQLAEQILSIEPRAKVALMSGFSGTWTPASVRLLGLVDMLVKPLSAAALAEGISRALGEAR